MSRLSTPLGKPGGVFFWDALIMQTVAIECRNCGTRVANYPREEGIPGHVARIVAGGCPECLALGPDRYFDSAGNELDRRTWKPISMWSRFWRDINSARVPGAIGASMTLTADLGTQHMDIENGVLKGGGAKWKKATSFGGAMAAPRWIVTHDTAGSTKKFSTVNYFASPTCKVSAHFVVERDGTITQMVQTNRRAYHAGVSKWNGVSGLNSCSIGIEIVNPGKLKKNGEYAELSYDGKTVIEKFPLIDCTYRATKEHGEGYWLPYTKEQIASVAAICREVVEEYPDCNEIVTHWMISPGRKIDTNPLFPMEEIRKAVFEPTPDDVPVALRTSKPIAEPVPAPQPTPTQELAKSGSGKSLLAVIVGWVCDLVFGIGQSISNGLDQVIHVLKPAQEEAETTIAPLMSLTRTLQINLGKVAIWGTIAVLVVVLVRHINQRVELAEVKQQLPEGPEDEQE
jgi:N-acetylmuramoyl-L-alanine amidase